MFFKRLPTGMLASNCYILADKGMGLVIDPGAKARDILEMIREANISIEYIILTHAHIDHIVSVDEIKGELNAKVMIHRDDAPSLGDPVKNGSKLFGLEKVFAPADVLLSHGDIIQVGGMELEIIHTPGHTPGGICIKEKDTLYTGDTLFRMSVGRTDLGDGDQNALNDSLKNRIMPLPDDTIIYPGHGTLTTIGYERKYNPFI